MLIDLHKSAHLTPAVRAEIAISTEAAYVLAAVDGGGMDVKALASVQAWVEQRL